MEIELTLKTKPACPIWKALEDLYEIHTKEIEHNKIEGDHKGR
jgi:hypothetical protein